MDWYKNGKKIVVDIDKNDSELRNKLSLCYGACCTVSGSLDARTWGDPPNETVRMEISCKTFEDADSAQIWFNGKVVRNGSVTKQGRGVANSADPSGGIASDISEFLFNGGKRPNVLV